MIIKSGGFNRPAITSLYLKALSNIEYTEKQDGSGTIQLNQKTFGLRWNTGMSWWRGLREPPSFEMIPDVKSVYNKIIDLQREIKTYPENGFSM